MRVAHLCKTFSKLSETFIYDYVREQHRQGLAAHVVAGRRENMEERPYKHVHEVSWPSLVHPRRVVSRLLEVTGLSAYGPDWRELWSGLGEAIVRIDPDVIHAHFGRAGVKAVPVAERLGIPLVVTFYGYDISQLPREEGWRQAYQKIWESASAITVLSEDMKRRAVKWGAPPERVHVVHLARDLDSFSFRDPQPPVTDFVTVGRLTEKKGHFDALQALEILAESGHDVTLTIAGDGPLKERLEQYVVAHDLASCVTLLGRVSNEEVARRLRDADAFVLCSKTSPSGDREGTPTVLIEAQAVGLPCVSTRHAGIPEMIPTRNHALLSEEGDVRGIAESMQQLVEASEQEINEIARAGRKKIESDFSLEREVKKLRALYDAL